MVTRAPAERLDTATLVAHVKAHANEHYNHPKTRWDLVVETMEDADIEKVIGKVTSRAAAVRRMWRELQPYSEQAAQHRAEAAAGM